MEKAKCHERCPYDKLCYYKGEDRDDFPDECSQYYKIEDLLWDARCDLMDMKRKEEIDE